MTDALVTGGQLPRALNAARDLDPAGERDTRVQEYRQRVENASKRR